MKKNFRDNLYFDETHQRQEISFTTYNLETLCDKYSQDWSFKKIKEGFLIRAPEEWLVDLTDPYKVIFYDNPITNLAYYNFLKEMVEKKRLDEFIGRIIKKYHLKNFNFQLLQGPGIESEIRIACSDNRGQKIRELMYSEVEDDSSWKSYLNKAKKFLGPIRNIKSHKESIHQSSLEVKSFFFSLMDFYKPFRSFRRDPFNPVFIDGLFNNFPEADVYLFIPWGCFYHISNFITKENMDKIMFWEFHSDPYQIHMNKYLAKGLKNKKVIIIDNSYTGSTLNNMAELVKKEGGKPIRFALFPKSKLAVDNSEYILFVDKILKSSDINTANPNWLKLTYKKVFDLKNHDQKLY